MSKRSHLNIVIAINIGGASGRDCLSGVFRFMNEGVNWRIQLFDSPLKLTAEAVGRADGVITEVPVPNDVLKAMRRRCRPVVFTDYGADVIPEGIHAERLQLDDVRIGETAFQFFSQLGAFASFVFMTDSVGKKWSDARQRGFCEAAKVTHREVLVLPLVADSANVREDQSVALKLSRLPKPVAIFSAWDKLSMRILSLCETAKVDVPGQAAVLGVDNDEILCRGVTPTLSSILPNHEALGYTAARELRRLLNGGRAKDITIRDSVREILRRDSTRIVQPAEHIIRNAKAFMLQHAAENITPRDVVRHLGISRALADLRFRELNGLSIRRQIAAVRIGEIKRRLMSSKNSLAEIARGCGFAGSPALSRYFKRETGQTPSEWRQR